MVKVEEIEEAIRLLENLRNLMVRVSIAKASNWNIRVRNPITDEIVQVQIPQEKIDAVMGMLNKRLESVASKLKSYDWSVAEV